MTSEHHSVHHDLPCLARSHPSISARVDPVEARVPRGFCPSDGGLEWRARGDSNTRPPDSKSGGNRRERPSDAGFRLAALPGTTGNTTTGVKPSRGGNLETPALWQPTKRFEEGS